MKSCKGLLLSISGILFIALLPACAFCGENSVRGKYFTVSYYDGCDLTRLAEKLQVRHFFSRDVMSGKKDSSDIQSIVANLFDAIYLEVSDILDIHIYSFHGYIKIVPNRRFVSDAVEKPLGKRPNVPSIYYHDEKTIYVAADEITLGMIAHEMGHVIISHYFVVPPSETVQEVLAGYVEYSIRKATGTLSELRR